MSGAGGGDGLDDDDDNDDSGGVDFGLLMADDASQSQYVTSQATDEMGDGSLLTGDNLLAVPRKVIHQFVCCVLRVCAAANFAAGMWSQLKVLKVICNGFSQN